MTRREDEDDRYMALAMALATQGEGLVEPNPQVGCLIVRKGAIVGQGWHERFGGPHAEALALEAAGDAARGATAYVTLEPCCHHGKTPPCTEAILQAGIKRVFVATEDKHAIVAGAGIKRLQDAGVEVEVGLLRHEAEALYTEFWKTIERKRPTVTVKIAQTMNGIAASTASAPSGGGTG